MLAPHGPVWYQVTIGLNDIVIIWNYNLIQYLNQCRLILPKRPNSFKKFCQISVVYIKEHILKIIVGMIVAIWDTGSTLFGAEAEIFREKYVNTMTADALDPCVVMESEAMASTLLD